MKMSIFDRFKKEKPLPGGFEPKPGVIEKRPSIMLAVPKDGGELPDAEALIERVRESGGLRVAAKKTGEAPQMIVEYEGEEFTVDFRVEEGFLLPELFRITHDFTPEESKAMESAGKGILTRMTFGEDNMKSFHVQLKVLAAMAPGMAGVVDYSSEHFLSGRWAVLAASSKVPPAPLYLYSVQAVNDEKEVWLHTHGLNRCGGIELEILKSDTDHYNSHYNVLSAVADRIVSENTFIGEYEAMYAGRLSSGEELNATWIDFSRAVRQYSKAALGGVKDRLDGHNTDTGVLYFYPDEESMREKKAVHISRYNDALDDNPILMKTNAETERMRALALERIGYMEKVFWSEMEAGILVKAGLEVDPEFKSGDMKEHIWFELKDLGDREFTGILTQEPYYVKGMKAGDEACFPYEDLTDWILYTPYGQITPDGVYKLPDTF